MNVLVDTSVWVAYFRGTSDGAAVDFLIEEDLIVTNDLVLAELTPPLLIRREQKLMSLLREIELVPLAPDWNGIVQMQVTCLRNGINKVGVADLMIAQNAMQNDLTLFSLDRHFALMGNHVPLSLY